jgi:EmrB/QacA subfamily drug resistance transporter
MASVDATIVVLALPSISEELNSPLYLTVWIIMGYTLVISVFTTQLGRIGDIYGRAKMYNIGFIIFTLGSALCGFAINTLNLIIARVIQAIGGALLQANSGAIIADNVPRNQVGKAFGYLALGWNAGATLGVVLGGLIATYLGWRFIFWINIPIGIFAVLSGLKVLKDKVRINAKLDMIGAFSLFLSLLFFSLSSSYVTIEGLNSVNILLIILGILFLIIFILIENNIKYPLIDLRIFKNKVLSASLFALLFQSLGALSLSFLLTLFLQGILGLNPFETSIALVPSYIISAILSPYSGRLSDRYGARIVATVGLSLIALSILLYILLLDNNIKIYEIILISILTGIGSAMFYPANNSAVMGNARMEFYGSISGMMRTLSNIGILGSYALSISISSLTIPRSIALEVFSSSISIGDISPEFLLGIKEAMIVSLVLILISIILSVIRGKEERILNGRTSNKNNDI